VRGDAPVDAGASIGPLDRSMLVTLRQVVDGATRAFDDFDYARALDLTERFFWSFCDDYLELVKQRAYGPSDDAGAQSARAALDQALVVLLGLFAPHLPFVSEEVWSWWRDGSVHRAPWPSVADVAADGDTDVVKVASEVLGEIRKAKSTAQRSMRTEVTRVVVRAPQDALDALTPTIGDVRDAGRVTGDLDLVAADELAVDVELADPEAA
jgi:valyl-tRNA synthetase